MRHEQNFYRDVVCRNLEPAGLEVTIRLQASGS
jgi:hypothetical protein